MEITAIFKVKGKSGSLIRPGVSSRASDSDPYIGSHVSAIAANIVVTVENPYMVTMSAIDALPQADVDTFPAMLTHAVNKVEAGVTAYAQIINYLYVVAAVAARIRAAAELISFSVAAGQNISAIVAESSLPVIVLTSERIHLA
jgi:hypothetical protein